VPIHYFSAKVKPLLPWPRLLPPVVKK